jgi:hypothetical protein
LLASREHLDRRAERKEYGRHQKLAFSSQNIRNLRGFITVVEG